MECIWDWIEITFDVKCLELILDHCLWSKSFWQNFTDSQDAWWGSKSWCSEDSNNTKELRKSFISTPTCLAVGIDQGLCKSSNTTVHAAGLWTNKYVTPACFTMSYLHGSHINFESEVVDGPWNFQDFALHCAYFSQLGT